MLQVERGKEFLSCLVKHQLENFLLWKGEDERLIDNFIGEALEKLEYSLSYSKMKHNRLGDNIYFSYLHQGQYAQFLYFLSNSIYQSNKDNGVSQLISTLNKSFNNIDLSHLVNMPQIFFTEHPLGTILSKGVYSSFFYCIQGCTIGAANSKEPLIFPKIGKNVTMLANSAILGDSTIGDFVTLGIGTVIKNQNIESDCIVFGQSPNLEIKRKSRKQSLEYSKELWKI